MNPKVLVGCPTFDGKAYCLEEYAKAVKNLDYDNYEIVLVDNSEKEEYREKLKKMGFNVWRLDEKGFSARERITACRNLLRKLAIDSYDYFLSLEQDVIPPKDIMKKLLSHNQKIVSAVYTMKMDDGKEMPLLWGFLDENEKKKFLEENPQLKSKIEEMGKKGLLCKRIESVEELPKNKLIKVAACGLGAVLIHKDVLKKIVFRTDERKSAYDDMFFSQDALSKGFEITADTGVICRHIQGEESLKNNS